MVGKHNVPRLLRSTPIARLHLHWTDTQVQKLNRSKQKVLQHQKTRLICRGCGKQGHKQFRCLAKCTFCRGGPPRQNGLRNVFGRHSEEYCKKKKNQVQSSYSPGQMNTEFVSKNDGMVTKPRALAQGSDSNETPQLATPNEGCPPPRTNSSYLNNELTQHSGRRNTWRSNSSTNSRSIVVTDLIGRINL
ncbi:unnamed protein product [Didymodactylos carnosus]|uniref:CCHC-type domain-containing protein n=1 Tax=Didymodactylos carnosus TaxID=1234261 RepID=A0A815I190_9BILA|nr:unnamed protein product [Didymodactylos carnosus]CAF1359221.1 unnamed protein product [Didymodactylos carnosus]CAF3842560.1 unnamed protein product [Didymodactylos carnosus]CAF4236155.1 unnamed protein product [Didymodactylos carnosus]